MAFSARQQEVLRHAVDAEHTLLLAIGSVRSGKTWSVGLSAVWFLARLTRGWDHFLLAISVEVAMRNIGFDLLRHVRALGGRADVSKRYGTCIRIRFPGHEPQSLWVIGAADEKGRKRLQGMTAMVGIVEELPLLPQAAWEFAWSRVSAPGAKCWATANPEGPGHWAKRTVADCMDQLQGKALHFRLRDNPSLDERTIERLEASYTGFQHKRLILGQWAAAAGACWPDWQVVKQDAPREWQSTIALDWALSGTAAALHLRHPTPVDRALVRHEWRHEGRVDGLLPPRDFAARIGAWVRNTLRLRSDGMRCIPDPAMPVEAKAALRNEGFRVRDGDNDVVPGIMAVNGRLADRTLLVHEDCRGLQDEMAGYVWDEKAALLGEDKPVKEADHWCDCLRYFVFTVWRSGPGAGAARVIPMRIRDRL